jgi:hypothetical protein
MHQLLEGCHHCCPGLPHDGDPFQHLSVNRLGGQLALPDRLPIMLKPVIRSRQVTASLV